MQPKRLLNRKEAARRTSERNETWEKNGPFFLEGESLIPVNLFHLAHLLYILRIATFQFLSYFLKPPDAATGRGKLPGQL